MCVCFSASVVLPFKRGLHDNAKRCCHTRNSPRPYPMTRKSSNASRFVCSNLQPRPKDNRLRTESSLPFCYIYIAVARVRDDALVVSTLIWRNKCLGMCDRNTIPYYRYFLLQFSPSFDWLISLKPTPNGRLNDRQSIVTISTANRIMRRFGSADTGRRSEH